MNGIRTAEIHHLPRPEKSYTFAAICALPQTCQMALFARDLDGVCYPRANVCIRGHMGNDWSMKWLVTSSTNSFCQPGLRDAPPSVHPPMNQDELDLPGVI